MLAPNANGKGLVVCMPSATTVHFRQSQHIQTILQSNLQCPNPDIIIAVFVTIVFDDFK